MVILLQEQKAMMESLLEAKQKEEAPTVPEKDYLTLFERGERSQVVDFVRAARPAQIEECVDVRHFTLLHCAVRAMDVEMVHMVLDKCPDMANAQTNLLRSPSGFTPLMTLISDYFFL